MFLGRQVQTVKDPTDRRREAQVSMSFYQSGHQRRPSVGHHRRPGYRDGVAGTTHAFDTRSIDDDVTQEGNLAATVKNPDITEQYQRHLYTLRRTVRRSPPPHDEAWPNSRPLAHAVDRVAATPTALAAHLTPMKAANPKLRVLGRIDPTPGTDITQPANERAVVNNCLHVIDAFATMPSGLSVALCA